MPGFVQLVGKHLGVREVLDLLGKPEPALDWFDLYKTYEIVCVRSAEARDAARRR